MSIWKATRDEHTTEKQKSNTERKTAPHLIIVPYLLFEPQKYAETIKGADKIAIILRKPDKRALSLWRSNLQNGLEWLDLERAIAYEQKRFYKLGESQPIRWRYMYFRGGLYSKKIEELKSLLGEKCFNKKVKFFLFENAFSDNRELQEFLKLENKKIPHLNRSYIPASPRLQFLTSRLGEIAKQEIKNHIVKRSITLMLEFLKKTNINLQRLLKINSMEHDKNTQAVLDFLEYAYREELEKLQDQIFKTKIW